MEQAQIAFTTINDFYEDVDSSSQSHFLNTKTKALIKQSYTVWRNQGKVSVTVSDKVSGLNAYSGKRYFRWQPVRSFGFRTTSTGLIMPYNVEGKRARTVLPLFDALDTDSLLPHIHEFKKVVKDELGIGHTSDIYTTLKFYPDTGRHDFSSYMLPFMRHTDYADFIKHVYGQKNFRKDLVKSAAGSDLHALEFTRAFKDYVPVDWIVDFLRNNPTVQYPHTSVPNLKLWRNIVAGLSDASRRNILRNTEWVYEDGYSWLDIMQIVGGHGGVEIPTMNFRNLHHLHDVLMGQRRAYRRPSNGPIKLTKLAAKLHNQSVDGLTIMMAENTDTMYHWSDVMSNCIRSYANIAVRGQGEYGGIYKDDLLIGNFEIRDHVLRQLLGKFNQNLPKEVVKSMEEFFLSKNVHVDEYWGKL